MSEQFLSVLDSHIGRTTSKFRTQGPKIAATLTACLFDFGNVESTLLKLFVTYDGQHQAATGQSTMTPE
jgi:hypothetical protein